MILERIDRIGDELQGVTRRLDALEALAPLAREVAELSRSMTVIAHAVITGDAPRAAPRGTPRGPVGS